jgi:UDP-N-acetylglucosamine acyltransferase
MCAIQQFVKIGKHTYIGGGSMVRKNVPPYIKAAREPLSYIGVNSTGLERREYNQSEINQIADIYRILFVKGNSLNNAIEIVNDEISDSKFKREILHFIADSPDGIIREFRELASR